MKFLPLLVLFSCLVGCNSTLNLACEDSTPLEGFPGKDAITKIDIAFEITIEGETTHFRESAICEYQGSFCPAGVWWEVWYGDQSINYVIDLAKNERLTIWPHGLCITLNEFKDNCAAGNCTPEDYFEFRLELSESRRNKRARECSTNNPDGVTDDPDEFVKCGIPGVDLVTLSELEEYGYEINNAKITVGATGL